jgi:glucose-1-phosphate cytidylyltransferase
MSDNNGRVTEFNEKPQAPAAGFRRVLCLPPELFDYLDNRENLMLEMEPMKRLVEDGQMMVYEHEGFWQPMDTYRDYLYLNDIWAKGKAPWKIW